MQIYIRRREASVLWAQQRLFARPGRRITSIYYSSIHIDFRDSEFAVPMAVLG